MYKKILIFLIIVILVIGIIFFVWKNNTKPSEEDKLKEKLNSEVEYLSSNLISIANNLNNIKIQEYEIKKQDNEDSSKSENKSSEKNSEQSGENSTSNSQSSSSEGSSSSKGEDSESTESQYSMKETTIDTEDVNWNNVDNQISNLYKTWSEILIDLYKVNNNNNENIKNFGKDLDDTTKYIKSNDKVNSLSMVAKLYSYLPKFVEMYENDTRVLSLINCKSNIIRAYCIIEQEKWEEIKQETASAIKNFNNILNDVEKNKNQYSANKIYILLNEFNSSIDTNSKEILYIKYRNLIQEIEYMTL